MQRLLPTKAQLAYLRALGDINPDPHSMFEASERIDAKKGGRA
jgi:hypothetical protein